MRVSHGQCVRVGSPVIYYLPVATKLAAVVEFGDAIHFLNPSLRSSNFSRSNAIALFLSLPTGYSAANVACLPWKCLST